MASASTTPDEPVWLSIPSAAARHDVSVLTLRRMISRGELPASRIGPRGGYRIRVSDLDAMMRPVRIPAKG
ncbi:MULTISPECIES: helix-turn-helix domain-containing protein [unclassified Microbacterium]|jgi:excisionase family DNA binding protein|uniref:helix-turn-helix domain-containing protein n=1 Tax=unclassified Microbacterium TaxID=2609290 RepID=UPI000BD8F4BC|nr:helix-turn-helix domain-containing protein [Microbacterium sp. 13-71-7]OZB83835.1 MAG: hypothetical protein B7X32_09070 [Microbacterium sp. 13-71-7]